jgi:uncharacterized protein (TIGR00251 family)
MERTKGGVRLRLRIQPRAARTELVGLHGDAIRIRLSAPPVDGAANEALLKFLADKLSVPLRAVRLTAGEASRSKVVTVTGIDLQHVAERLDLQRG